MLTNEQRIEIIEGICELDDRVADSVEMITRWAMTFGFALGVASSIVVYQVLDLMK